MIWLDEGGRQRGAHLIAPPSSLRGSVEHLWVHGPLPRRTWRVVPDVSAHLIFQMAAGAVRCDVVGARSTYCDIRVTGRDLTIGVRFCPGALPQLTGDSASHLRDRSESLEAVIGPEGRRLTERLANAAPGERLLLLTQLLSARLRPARHTWRFEADALTALARECRVSRRALYDRTFDAVGLGPKRALRIQRLHRALSALGDGATLVDAALGAGYSDQPHLTREAVRLLGESPGEWRRRGRSIVQDAGTRTHR